MFQGNWNKWEMLRGAVSREECQAIGLSYLFHIDRQYLSSLGCFCRIVLWGHTLEVYRPYNGDTYEPEQTHHDQQGAGS